MRYKSRKPAPWWQEDYRDDPLLWACATAGLTAEETILKLFVSRRDMIDKVERLIMYQTGPIVLQIADPERTAKVDDDGRSE